MTRLSVGIMGVGMVGEPIRRWFQEVHHYQRGDNLFCYDTDPKQGYTDDVARAQVIFVCVPTPPNPDGSCNTSIVASVVASIPDGRIIIIKSTVPPGTTQRLQDQYPGKLLMFNPEFLTESQAWEDFCKPSRQIIGVTEQSMSHAVDVLNLLPQAPFMRPDTPIYGQRLIVSATEAELTKYASNVFGALKVVFGNLLADFCDGSTRAATPIFYDHIRDMLGADRRIGSAWLDVDHGTYNGFGGYCFPKDTAACIRFFDELIKNLEAHPSVSVQRVRTLRAGLLFLRAAYTYNEVLLSEQGLTIPEVSAHNKDLILKKRRLVRGA